MLEKLAAIRTELLSSTSPEATAQRTFVTESEALGATLRSVQTMLQREAKELERLTDPFRRSWRLTGALGALAICAAILTPVAMRYTAEDSAPYMALAYAGSFAIIASGLRFMNHAMKELVKVRHRSSFTTREKWITSAIWCSMLLIVPLYCSIFVYSIFQGIPLDEI